MRDLFSLDRQFETISMPDADVSILHQIEMPQPYDQMLRKLIEETQWRQEAVRIYGKEHQQPRLVALHADKGQKYDYSGISLQTQHFWKHGINKQTQPCGPRVNLTFRTLFS